jgi:hypothetical protein
MKSLSVLRSGGPSARGAGALATPELLPCFALPLIHDRELRQKHYAPARGNCSSLDTFLTFPGFGFSQQKK